MQLVDKDYETVTYACDYENELYEIDICRKSCRVLGVSKQEPKTLWIMIELDQIPYDLQKQINILLDRLKYGDTNTNSRARS